MSANTSDVQGRAGGIRMPWTYGFVLGLGYFGISAIGPIYNTYVPLLLSDFGLSATLVGFVMTWDNWLNLFIPAGVGTLSDRTWTRWGRRKPWILAAAPFAILLYPLIPLAPALVALLALLVAVNIAVSVMRAPGLSFLGDMFAPAERSKASGIINLLGGLGIVLALVGSGFVYRLGPAMPFVLGSLLLLGGMLIFTLAVHERRDWGGTEVRSTSGIFTRIRSAPRQRLANAAKLLLAIFFSFCAFNILETWISSFARFALGMEPDRIPFIIAVFAGFLLIGAVPSGFLGARVGQKRVVALGMAIMAVLLAAGFLVRSVVPLLFLLAPAGVAWALIIINIFPLLYAVGGEGRIGMFTGLYYTVTSLAAILGPQVVGLLLDASGQDYRLMWLMAALSMALAIVFLSLLYGNDRVS